MRLQWRTHLQSDSDGPSKNQCLNQNYLLLTDTNQG